MKGTVTKSTGSWISVLAENGLTYPCKIKGTFKIRGIKATNPVAVGDHVNFEIGPDQKTGLIASIENRKNYIIRKSVKLSKQVHILAANVDMAYIVASLVAPDTSLGFIDRFLATTEAYGIPATLLINKKDLFEDILHTYALDIQRIYEKIGYPVHIISTFDTQDIELLKSLLKDRINLFSGQSGTGKTSLINAIIPGYQLKTAEISIQHLKGRHTTTFAEMHQIPGGGFIIDTPGIRDFGIIEMDKYEVGHYFPEMRALLNQCQFNNCLHENEPNCAVKSAVEKGLIEPSRYYNYLSMIHNEDKFN